MSPDLVKRARRERWARELASSLDRLPANVWFAMRHPHLTLAFYGWVRFPKPRGIRV